MSKSRFLKYLLIAQYLIISILILKEIVDRHKKSNCSGVDERVRVSRAALQVS
jgi:hypothetical protein